MKKVIKNKKRKGLALSERSESKGFTLFVAMVVMGTLLLVSTGLVSLAVRQAKISSAARESQHAFYAADSGMECAIYWDVKNPSGISAFATSTASSISCNGESPVVVGGSSQSSFTILFSPDPYCATVTVTKPADGSTLIEALGYNTCDVLNNRRVERAVRATY